MHTILPSTLLIVFLVHLIAFAALGLRRRQGYYAALVVTFALLSSAVALSLFAPDLNGFGGLKLHETIRYGAWIAALVSISWTLLRISGRIRQRGRQNCS